MTKGRRPVCGRPFSTATKRPVSAPIHGAIDTRINPPEPLLECFGYEVQIGPLQIRKVTRPARRKTNFLNYISQPWPLPFRPEAQQGFPAGFQCAVHRAKRGRQFCQSVQGI